MLKRRIGSIFLTASMLAGMYIVPANAKTREYRDTPVTKTIIHETFDNCTEGSTMGKSTTRTLVSGADEQTYINSYEGWDTTLSIKKDENNNNNYASMVFGSGAKLDIQSKSGSTRVKEGDIITVSFKFKSNYAATNGAPLIINLDDHKKAADGTGTACRFLRKEQSTNANVASYPIQGNNQLVDTKYDGRILNLFMGKNRYSMNGTWGTYFSSGATYSTTEWNDVTITINTADSDPKYNGEQTLKAEVKYTENGEEKSSYFKGLYDADYAGDSSDTKYDKITSIGSIQIDSLSAIFNLNESSADFDDIKVELQTTESKLSAVSSSLDGTIINETFNDCTANEAFGKNQVSAPAEVTGADENTTIQAYNNWSTVPLTIKDESGNKYAYMNFNDGAKLSIQNKNGTTPVKTGDIVKVSFKFKSDHTAANGSPLIINLDDHKKADGKGTACRFLRKEQSANANVASYPIQGNNQLVDTNYDGRILNLFMGQNRYSMNGTWGAYFSSGATYSTTEWNDVTITINTSDSDPIYNGEQTLKAEVKYTENGEEKSSYFKGLYDANYAGDSSDTKYDKITSIGSIQIDSLKYCTDATAMFDDIKVQVISPTFEIWGDATKVDNVDGALDDEYIQGKALTVKASVFDSDSVLLVGVYDENDDLIGCKTAKVGENGSIIEAAGIDTSGAESIKLFLWNGSSIRPYIESKKLTKYTESASSGND